MTNNSSVLNQLGLTDIQIKIFEYLLEFGPNVSGPTIYNQLKIDKATVYRALNDLESLGLVAIKGGVKKKLFSATKLNKIKSLYNAKLENIINLEKTIDKYIESVSSDEENYKENIRIHKGIDEYFNWQLSRLDYPGITEISDVIFWSKLYEDIEGYDTIGERIFKKRVKKKIKLRILTEKNGKRNKMRDTTSLENYKEVRSLPKNFRLNTSLSIYGEYVAITRKDGKNIIVLEIKDSFINQLFKQFFNYVWNDSTEI